MSYNSANMYAGYNKGEGGGNMRPGGARLGNWVEEIALEAATGSSRGLDMRDKTAGQATPHRVIYHTEREEPKDYRTTGRLVDPSTNTEHSKPPRLGPRAAARAKEVDMDTVRLQTTETREDEHPGYVSSQRAAHAAPPAEWYGANRGKGTVGGVVFSDGNGPSLAGRRAELDADLDEAGADEPVTVHQQAIAGRGGVYAGSVAGGRNPMGKCTVFTNDIRNGAQLHAGATDTADGTVTKLPPSAMQRGAIARLRKAGGADGFWRDEDGFAELGEFVDGLQEFGASGADVSLLATFFAEGQGQATVDLQEVNRWLA